MRLHERMAAEFKITPAEARHAIRAFNAVLDAWTYRDGHKSFAVVRGLEAAAEVLKAAGFSTYGVEGNCGQSFQDDYRDPPSMGASIVDYLNRGDTYAATLVYDYRYRGGCLRVTTWGDIVDACDRDFGRVYEA